MRIDVLKPNITRIAYHQTEDDEHYGSCMWAYYDFDLDRYMLNIQSDCGNAAYRWVETQKSESFLHLMARISNGYLMKKLFRREKVDVDATLDEVREWLGIGEDEDYQRDDLTDEEREELGEAMNELEALLSGCTSEGHAMQILEDWNSDNGFNLDCIYERVVTDYTCWQKRIVKIFADYVQPRIKEILKDGDYE